MFDITARIFRAFTGHFFTTHPGHPPSKLHIQLELAQDLQPVFRVDITFVLRHISFFGLEMSGLIIEMQE